MTSPTHEQVQPCPDLAPALERELEAPGTRLLSIFPADAPRVAVIERDGKRIRLDASPGVVAGPAASDETEEIHVPPIQPSVVHSNSIRDPDAWVIGRAGMAYRDLIPGRLGGHVIASHIRIENGGLVPDSVHHHAIRYQLIVCVQGWVRVVYEDQGEPFELRAGDAVLQPPSIRHRVLESSDGLEVVEVACPAEHRTTIDHELELPNSKLDPHHDFSGQRFVRHVAGDAEWTGTGWGGLHQRDLGIGAASGGTLSARVLRADGNPLVPHGSTEGLRILFGLQGRLDLRIEDQLRALYAGETLTIPSGTRLELWSATEDLELLEITAPD
jgi:quercetin dioxygenase-like cupin family protein